MAAGRRRLSKLVWEAAAARRGRPSFLCSTYHLSPSASTSQHSFFSSWLERNVGCYDLPANPRPFTLGTTHSSLSSTPRGLAQVLDLAPASTPSSYRSPVSGSPSTSQSVYCPQINIPSLLYVSDVKTDTQTHVSEPSKRGDSCTPTEKNNSSSKHRSPWSSREVVNWPNAISFGRLLSGPLLAWLIMEGLLQPAVVGLIIAGASDWFDGYIARRQGINSVFGTYLDPLADKVLIGCVAFSMAQAGYLSLALVALVIARDAALIGGSIVLSAQNLKSQVTSLRDLYNATKGGAQKIEPLYISKINTVFQLALVGVALLQPAFGIEDSYSLIPLLR
ncbi:hypothetical protein GOP47_0013181 [Adiantum capillus-veneris]|uniref:Uncharacterized protein n=1 Tax=Adiantum capillus-veneris TaxID=13818 RepID=A0A9D4ZF22_ADICA|nr:hypothetical protein GOP47_0013181 [Adiantum capillus-veneris]